jgi:hypothetical protein
MREWNVGQRSIGPGLHKQWHDSQVWIHTLHLPSPTGRRQPVSYAYANCDYRAESHADAQRYSNGNCDARGYAHFNAASATDTDPNSYTSAI